MSVMFSDQYRNRKVLVTGHTGFKGSWLVYWLNQMGADVYGYSLPSETNPNHNGLLKTDKSETLADISDLNKLKQVFNSFCPEIVFHMAAQPLVRDSYSRPVETFQSNVMGTVNVLEAIRLTSSVKAAVMITTDKCYENKEWLWGYRENDRLGGYDPYSSSKACCELVIASYRNSFFAKSDLLVASCRAGNVIGGGDWARDRLLPDIMVATSKNEVVSIRNPHAVRPWQHVLESLSGYLLLGQNLLEGKKELAQAWNFGPSTNDNITVGEVLDAAVSNWEKIKVKFEKNDQLHEAGKLMLDCSKANELLKWKPVWNSAKTAVEKTVEWYKSYYSENRIITAEQLDDYIKDARLNRSVWIED